jgi:hypothetical protein
MAAFGLHKYAANVGCVAQIEAAMMDDRKDPLKVRPWMAAFGLAADTAAIRVQHRSKQRSRTIAKAH